MSYPTSATVVDFNPRFPRGKRLYYEVTYNGDKKISIHASREGSDVVGLRGAGLPYAISIHASREGSDGVTHNDNR